MKKLNHKAIIWAGAIPSNWGIARLKDLVSFRKGLNITKEDLVEEGIPVISYGQIHSKQNTGTGINCSLIRYVPESYLVTNQDCLVKKNDFLFADTSEDYEGCGNCVYIDKDLRLFAGYHTIIASSKDCTDNRYLAYQMLTDAWRSQIRSKVWGIKVFSITRGLLANAYTILPPISKQKIIADFLDSKCTIINDVIEKTKSSIEEYKKLKQSLITEAVTKGIHSASSTKKSDIDWAGDIPSSWQTRRIKTLFVMRDEKNYLPLSDVNLISLYTDKGVVQHSDLLETTGNKASNADGYKIVAPNDIIVNIILAWMGAIGRCDYHGVTSPAYDIYIPLKNTNSKFYHYYFRTKGFSGDCFKRGRGIMMMRWRTYSDEFKDIRVVYPPIHEQNEIVDYLDRKCSEIDSVIISKEKIIASLEQYRKSLIYEYVTGKKEVIA